MNSKEFLDLHFPNNKSDFDDYFYFTNFRTLEGFEMSVEDFYKQLINKV